MRYNGQKKRHLMSAFLAINLFVFQLLLASLSAQASTTPMLDAFGNPLCITSTQQSDDNLPIPDCCTLSCSMFAVTENDDLKSNSVKIPFRLEITLIERSLIVSSGYDKAASNPASPRYPPIYS